MKKNPSRMASDERLREIARILARGVLRMRDDKLLSSSGYEKDDPSLSKPPMSINQRASG